MRQPDPHRWRGLPAAEALAWAAVAGVLLFQNPFGDLGPEADRQLLLQGLALAGLAALAIAGFMGAGVTGATSPAVVETGPPVTQRRLPLVAAALVWGAISLLSACFSVDPLRSLLGAPPRLTGFVSELALVVLFLFWVFRFRDASARRRTDDALFLASAALVAYALLQWAGLDPMQWDQDWQGRPTGAQGNPLFLAQALVWIAPLLGARSVARWREGRRPEALASLAVLLAALAVLLRTGARGALLGVGASALVFFAIAGGRDARTPPVPSGGARRSLAIALVVLSGGIAIATIGVMSGEDRPGTAGQRALLWRSVGAMFAGEPAWRTVLGQGQESLPIALPPYLPPELPGRIWTPDRYHDRAHNAVLDAFAAGGALRALATFALFGLALLAAARGTVAEGASDSQRVASVGALAALVGHGVALQTGVATAATAALFWLVLALLAGGELERIASRPVRAQRKEEPKNETGVLVAQIGLVLSLVIFSTWVPEQVGGGAAGGRRLLLYGALLALSGLLAFGRFRVRVMGFATLAAASYAFAHVSLLRGATHELVVLGLVVALVVLMALGARSVGPPPNGALRRLRPLWAVPLAGAALAFWFVAAEVGSGVALKRGRSLLVTGRADLAAIELERARRLAPAFEDGSIALVRTHARLAERAVDETAVDDAFAQARSILDAARALHPLLPELALEQAHLSARRAEATKESGLRRSRYDEAVEAYRDALRRDPQNSAGHRGLGASWLELGELEKARAELSAAVRLAPRSIESRLLLGRVELARGDFGAARAEFEAARAVDEARVGTLLEGLARARPRDATAYRDLALHELLSGRPERAQLALEQALRVATPGQIGPIVRLLSEARVAAGSPP